MSLNLDFQIERKAINWNGVEVARVRGLTPHDILGIIAANPVQVDDLFEQINGGVKDNVNEDSSAEEIADAVQGQADASMQKILMTMPDLVAKVIAVACDSPDRWEHIQKNFVLPLQFDAVSEIARLTFVDPPGFRRFVGNVMALVGTFRGGQGNATLPDMIGSAG